MINEQHLREKFVGPIPARGIDLCIWSTQVHFLIQLLKNFIFEIKLTNLF